MRDLAHLLDEPFQLINKIESAERKLSVHEYVQYCNALGIDASDGLKILEGKVPSK
jgi:hypothetical protein